MGPGPPTSVCWSHEEDMGKLCACLPWPGAALTPLGPWGGAGSPLDRMDRSHARSCSHRSAKDKQGKN